MQIVLQKLEDTLVSNVFSSQGKLCLQSSKKVLKAKRLQKGDLISGLEIVSVDKNLDSDNLEIYATNMQKLKQELNSIFEENWWDFTNKKALKILKRYNVILAEKVFSGTRIVTKLGVEEYFSGEPMLQDMLEFDVKDIDWSTVQKVATLTK